MENLCAIVFAMRIEKERINNLDRKERQCEAYFQKKNCLVLYFSSFSLKI